MKERMFTAEAQSQVPPSESIPKIKIIESAPTTPAGIEERMLRPIPDSQVHDIQEMSYKERNEAFSQAFNSIVGNKKLLRLVFKGIELHNQIDRVDYLSQVNNAITEQCILLSDDEIDRIMQAFKLDIVKHVDQYAREFAIRDEDMTAIKSGKITSDNFIDSFNKRGIQSVIHFVRDRKKVHAGKETIPALYFQNYLDARYAIDLIEVDNTQDGVELRLIQIKSKQYDSDEIDHIHQKHASWTRSKMVDIDAYERMYEEEPKDSTRWENFFSQVDTLEQVLLEFVTNENISKEELLKQLAMTDIPRTEQVWIIDRYMALFTEAYDELKDELDLDVETRQRVQKVIDVMQSEVTKVQQKLKDLKGVRKVYSVCTVDKNIVSEQLVFDGEENGYKAIHVENT
jgi:hypothetical protein